MGAGFGRLLGLFFSNKEFRVLMVGLDAAGKTTILYKLHLGEVVTTIPTIGFNVERVKYKNVSFTVWDVGGQQKIRPLWRHYYEGSDAIIFVIDSNDKERFDEASEELKHLLMQDTLKEAAILILANKQDLPNAVTAAQISEKVSLPKNRMWHVQPCCAPTGEGLFQGLDWLAAILAKKK